MTTEQLKSRWAATSLLAIVCTLLVEVPHVSGQVEQARVPRELMTEPAYTQYATMLIQLDMVSNPKTADLPISVVAPETGTILLSGTVGSDQMKQYLIQNAQRISGLGIKDSLRTGPVNAKYRLDISKEKLEFLTTETLGSLFPELAEKVRTTVTEDGTIVLTGTASSYEAKTMLSQAVKSQPGCRAVANLLRVPADPNTGLIRVSHDGSMQVKASLLPSVPAAPLQMPDVPSQPAMPPSIRDIANRPIVADDAPEPSLLTQQLIEDAQAALNQSGSLESLGLEIDTDGTAIVLKGDAQDQRSVEEAISALKGVPGTDKIVALTTPVSIQYNVVDPSKVPEAVPVEPRKILGFIPLGRKSFQRVEQSRPFRERIRKSLEKLCGDSVEGLSVKSTASGLLIKGEVNSARDRSFVFKQVDNIIELSPVPYMVVLKVKQ